jgi:hypothetical protein
MADAVSTEQARAQVWEMMLEKAREAQHADPKAASAAKTLLANPSWKDVIEESVIASPVPGSAEGVADGDQEDREDYIEVPWQGVYPGYIGGELAFGPAYADFDAAKTEKEGSFVIENIGWGFAASK